MSVIKEKILKDIEAQVASGKPREEAINDVLSYEYKVFEEELNDFKHKLGLLNTETTE